MPSLKNLYLIAYNGTLCVGWSVVLFRVISHLLSPNATGGMILTTGPYEGMWEKIRMLLTVSQTAALMEILHALVGLVKSPVMTTFIQVMSRIVVLWGALLVGAAANGGTTEVQASWFMPQMLIAWSLTEVVRYAYYVVGLTVKDKSDVPSALTFLRYSMFLVLYPMGITGEMGCLWHALPTIAATKPYTVALPNTMNFAFSYESFVWFTLIGLYPPGAYVMYSYMLGQRKKVLSPPRDDKKKQ